MAGKTAGVTVYLMEELGDARMRCDQLLRYVEKASQLIEKSAHKDHVFEVAGDLIRGIPESAFKLHKALQAVALAAGRLDYEEIKQDLRPEKVEELERVLKDVRVRHVQRRSLPMINPGKVVQDLRSLAKQARDSGRLDTDGLSALIAALESGAPKVANEANDKAATQLEAMAHALENPPAGEQPSRFRLAQVLRRTLAAHVEVSSSEETAKQAQLFKSIEEEAMFEVAGALSALKNLLRGTGNPRRTRALMMSALAFLGRLTNVLGQDPAIGEALTRASDILFRKWSMTALLDKAVPSTMYHPADPASGFAAQASIDPQPRDAAEVTKALDDFIKYARLADIAGGTGDYKRMFGNLIGVLNQVQYLTNIFDIEGTGFVQRVVKAIKPYTNLRPTTNFASVHASDDEKLSRYEEGKSADPTENMNEADAEEWKANTEEHGDKFKKDAASKAPQVIFQRMKDAVEGMLEARVKIRQVHEDLSGINSDATGTVFTNNYRNSEIERVSNELYELDHGIGRAWRNVEHLEKTMKQTMIKSAAEDEKRSRYEEGKSADPTENMSDADAKEWKENTEEHGDKFKAASGRLGAMQTGQWYVQKFNDRDEMYFFAVSEQKNGGVAGILVDPTTRPQAKKTSVSKMDMRLWKPTAEGQVPADVKGWAERKKTATDSSAWKVA